MDTSKEYEIDVEGYSQIRFKALYPQTSLIIFNNHGWHGVGYTDLDNSVIGNVYASDIASIVDFGNNLGEFDVTIDDSSLKRLRVFVMVLGAPLEDEVLNRILIVGDPYPVSLYEYSNSKYKNISTNSNEDYLVIYSNLAISSYHITGFQDENCNIMRIGFENDEHTYYQGIFDEQFNSYSSEWFFMSIRNNNENIGFNVIPELLSQIKINEYSIGASISQLKRYPRIINCNDFPISPISIPTPFPDPTPIPTPSPQNIFIETFSGISKQFNYCIPRNSKIEYKSDSDSLIILQFMKEHISCVVYDDNGNIIENNKMRKDYSFQIKCQEDYCNYSFIIAKIPFECGDIHVFKDPYTSFEGDAYIFDQYASKPEQKICFLSTFSQDYWINVINPSDLGQFIIYNDPSYNNGISTKGIQFNTSIVGKSGVMMMFIPNQHYIDIIKKNEIKYTSPQGYNFSRHFHTTIFSFKLCPFQLPDYIPKRYLSIPSSLFGLCSYKKKLDYYEFISNTMSIIFTKWNQLQSYNVLGYELELVQFNNSEGLTTALSQYYSNPYYGYIDKVYYSSAYYESFYDSVNAYLRSKDAPIPMANIEGYQTILEGFIQDFDLKNVIDKMILGNPQSRVYWLSMSLKELSEIIAVGYDEQGNPVFVNIPEMIDSIQDSLSFWLDVLGLNDLQMQSLIEKIRLHPNTVYIPDILSCLHIEFKYILKLGKIIENMLQYYNTTYEQLFLSLPKDISAQMKSIFVILKNFISTKNTDIDSIDVLLNDFQSTLKSIAQSFVFLTLDSLNSVFGFFQYVLTSKTGGDFNSRLNKFIVEKGAIIPEEIRVLLGSFSKSQCNIIEFITNHYPSFPINIIINIAESFLGNQTINSIMGSFMVDTAPNTFRTLDAIIRIFGSPESKLEDVFGLFGTDLIQIFSQILNGLCNRYMPLDKLFGEKSIDYYFNETILKNLTSYVKTVSSYYKNKQKLASIDYSSFFVCDLFTRLINNNNISSFIDIFANEIGLRIDSKTISKAFLSCVNFIERRKDQIISLIDAELHPVFLPLLNTISNIQKQISNEDIGLGSILKVLFNNGNQIISIMKDSLNNLSKDYSNYSLFSSQLPKSFIDIESTLSNLEKMTIGSFLNIIDCIVVKKEDGKVSLFDIIPLDKLKTSVINLNQISLQRSIVMDDLSNEFGIARMFMTLTKFIKNLWTTKLTPVNLLETFIDIDFTGYFSSLYLLKLAIQSDSLGANQLTTSINSTISSYNALVQQPAPMTTPAKSPISTPIFSPMMTNERTPKMTFEKTLNSNSDSSQGNKNKVLQYGVGGAIVLVVLVSILFFGFFSRKTPDDPTEFTVEATLV